MGENTNGRANTTTSKDHYKGVSREVFDGIEWDNSQFNELARFQNNAGVNTAKRIPPIVE